MTRSASAMGFETREPCQSCPYRCDVPVGTWHREEFENLLKQDENEFGGSIFGCHATAKLNPAQVCAGWLLDQKRRGLPSIQLRLKALRDPSVIVALDAVTGGGHELYESIEAMCAANGVTR